MAMYYYASKLNEAASCSGCHRKAPQPPPLPAVSNAYFPGPSHSQAGAAGGRRLLMNGGGASPEGPRPPPRNISPDPQRAGPSNGEAGLPEAVAGALVVSELEYRDGQVVSGTLEALIDLLRPGADRNFIFAFLLCSRIYVRPHELLATLCRRHTLTGQVHLSGEPVADVALAEMTSLVRLLGEWTRNFPYDFRDDRVMALVRNIAQTCASEEMSSLRDEMSLLLQKLLDRLTALEKYESTLNDIPYAPSILKTTPNDVMTTGLSPMALARQLTLLELHLLSFVGPEEFIQAFIQTTRDTMHLRKTRNLEAYRKWFNRLNYLVVTDILKSAKTKPRAKILEHWILCARECFNLGNFNSLMAIVGALNMICISRLKKTWGRCSNVIQQLPPLERCMEPSANHARYRAALAAANGSTHPAVPCFSITCRDLHFINQTSRNWVSGNRINLDKCRSLARHISEQLSHVHTDTGFVRHNDTWEYLLKTPILSETTMEIASFEREPPNDHSEKDLYKSLRNNLR